MAQIQDNPGGFILIIEDDPGVSELEARRLEPLGLAILRATNYGEALKILKRSRPELMVLDYSLPGINALGLLARLKKNLRDIPPFIVVTGRGDETVAVKSMKAGALDYIVKDSAFLDNLLPVAKNALEKCVLPLKLKKAEECLRNNLRRYNFLAQVNQAAVRNRNRKDLLREICEIAAGVGGFRTAWVAEPNRYTESFALLISAGTDSDSLRSLRTELSSGKDPTSPVIAASTKKKIAVSTAISTGPGRKSWCEFARMAGVKYVAALPLLVKGELNAILGLCSSEPACGAGLKWIKRAAFLLICAIW